MRLLKALGIWAILPAAAIANGAARNAILVPHMGEQAANQVSTARARALMGVGLFWLLLTVSFEFLFGHFVAGASWERLVDNYDLAAGRLWVVVLVTVLLAPLVAARLRGLGRAPGA